MARSYSVFNLAQVDGYVESTVSVPVNIESRNYNAETYFNNTRAIIRHCGDGAFYKLTGDYINMPMFSQFKSAELYYSTLAHETTHWTGHRSRCARFEDTIACKGDRALEEMVAELGAAFTCAKLGLSPEPRPDHAAYIASWIKALRSDKKYFFKAASAAQKASDYLDSLQSCEAEREAA